MQTTIPLAKYFLCSMTTRAARKLVAYYNRELAPLGITAQQLMALGVLCFEEDISLGVFAQRAGIGKAAAATMIQRLEIMDLVTKGPHPQDARLNVLKITDKTRELIPKLHEKVSELETTIESQLGVSDLKSFVEGLSRFLELEF